MVFRRRKLLNDSLQIIAVNCTQFCDPKKNLDGLCPLPCLPLCFSTCRSTLFSPQDPPPPAAADFASVHPVKHFRVSLFLTVFLSILATSFFLFSFYTALKFYRNRRSGGLRRSENQGEEDEGFSDFVGEDHGLTVDHPIWYIRTVGLQSSIINAITVCKYKRGEGLVEGTECSICLNEFQEDETLRLLPKCNHAFHIPCIDTWLRSHTNCPLCRAGIVSNTGPWPAEQSVESSVFPVQETETRDEEQIEIENMQEGFEEEIEIEEMEGERREVEIGMKRSFSLDSVSALMVSAAVVKAFADESNVAKKTERQKGASSSSSSSSSSLMKRSLSCGGKIFSSRYNRRPSSAILPR